MDVRPTMVRSAKVRIADPEHVPPDTREQDKRVRLQDQLLMLLLPIAVEDDS